LLWCATRREWRNLASALGVTAALAVASFALRPEWWSDWIGLITRDQGNAAHQLPWLRYAIAAVIVAWGARTDRPWTVPLGAFFALPVIYPDSFTFLLGCVAVLYASVRRARGFWRPRASCRGRPSGSPGRPCSSGRWPGSAGGGRSWSWPSRPWP